MGSNTIVTQSDGTVIDASDINQYKTAIITDFMSRNSSGVPADIAGSLGTSSIAWLKAFIASGYWNIGDIKPHHSFNAAVDPGQGWILCDGSIINEANYEAQSWVSVGDWDIYIGSSGLDGKYTPNLTDKYLVGKATTTQTGASAITSVGNSSNQIDIQHTHTVDGHNHRWYNKIVSADDQVWDASGSAITVPSGDTANKRIALATGSDTGLEDSWTENESLTSNNSLSTTQSVQPESIEVQYYIRII